MDRSKKRRSFKHKVLSYGIRPVITLKSTLIVGSGDGTLNSPFKLK